VAGVIISEIPWIKFHDMTMTLPFIKASYNALPPIFIKRGGEYIITGGRLKKACTSIFLKGILPGLSITGAIDRVSG